MPRPSTSEAAYHVYTLRRWCREAGIAHSISQGADELADLLYKHSPNEMLFDLRKEVPPVTPEDVFTPTGTSTYLFDGSKHIVRSSSGPLLALTPNYLGGGGAPRRQALPPTASTSRLSARKPLPLGGPA